MYFQYGEKEISFLKQKDKRLAAVMERIGEIKRPLTPDLFTAYFCCGCYHGSATLTYPM